MSRPLPWHIVTPSPGGVGDYASALATELAAGGDEVHLWGPTPGHEEASPSSTVAIGGVGGFSPRDLWRLEGRMGATRGPRRLLVQWVPHGFGWRSTNLPFCLWVWKRSVIDRDRVELMVHEPGLAFREGGWRQDLIAVVHRLMLLPLLAATRTVWMAIPAWEPLLRRYALGRQVRFRWLPIPSNVPVAGDRRRIEEVRGRYGGHEGPLIGHFGTYGRAIAELLRQMLPPLLLADPGRSLLLLGRGGEEFRERLLGDVPQLEARIHATGELPPTELSAHLGACDLMVQPYPDGVSTRRTSTMAALAHGRAVVTNAGHLTEPFWEKEAALALAPTPDVPESIALAESLLHDSAEAARLGRRAAALYAAHFDIRHAVAALRGGAATAGEADQGDGYEISSDRPDLQFLEGR